MLTTHCFHLGGTDLRGLRDAARVPRFPWYPLSSRFCLFVCFLVSTATDTDFWVRCKEKQVFELAPFKLFITYNSFHAPVELGADAKPFLMIMEKRILFGK